MRKAITTVSLDPQNVEDGKILARLNGHESFSDFINTMLEQACDVERYRIEEMKRLKISGIKKCNTR